MRTSELTLPARPYLAETNDQQSAIWSVQIQLLGLAEDICFEEPRDCFVQRPVPANQFSLDEWPVHSQHYRALHGASSLN